MKFPYRDYEGILLPIVPIELFGFDWFEEWAYVDSGASYSIFHTDVAEVLGILWQAGKEDVIQGGNGAFMTIYLHELPVRFAGKEFDATVGFSEGLGVGFNLLGRKSFFNRFKICFEERDYFVEATPLVGGF